MAKKKAGGANNSKWVKEPKAAPEGKPFCDVTYEHRCHTETISVAGITFVPGQIVTYYTRADVPDELLEHPELSAYDAAFGVCRIDPMFRYTSLTLGAYEALVAGVAEPEVVADSDQPEPAPLPDDAEPEGGE